MSIGHMIVLSIIPFFALNQGYTLPPLLLGANHHFEWGASYSQYSLTTINISIDPLYQFLSP